MHHNNWSEIKGCNQGIVIGSTNYDSIECGDPNRSQRGISHEESRTCTLYFLLFFPQVICIYLMQYRDSKFRDIQATVAGRSQKRETQGSDTALNLNYIYIYIYIYITSFCRDQIFQWLSVPGVEKLLLTWEKITNPGVLPGGHRYWKI